MLEARQESTAIDLQLKHSSKGITGVPTVVSYEATAQGITVGACSGRDGARRPAHWNNLALALQTSTLHFRY